VNRSDYDYPPATDDTICETCGERGHYWCQPSRILFKGRGRPPIYLDDFEDEAADQQRAEVPGEMDHR